tara:strand:- start:4937 stop:5392 length:456 start_codon:yes stop_codon:yes gene_type:complete
METNEPNVIKGGVAVDDRGSVSFVNDFDFSGVKRFYQVQNHERGFIRAWHGHVKEGKYVYVPHGSALVGAVEMPCEDDPDQVIIPPSVFRCVLSSKSPSILWIPPNHANGFMTLSEETVVQFFSTSSLEDSLNDDIRYAYDKWNIWDIEYR